MLTVVCVCVCVLRGAAAKVPRRSLQSLRGERGAWVELAGQHEARVRGGQGWRVSIGIGGYAHRGLNPDESHLLCVEVPNAPSTERTYFFDRK